MEVVFGTLLLLLISTTVSCFVHIGDEEIAPTPCHKAAQVLGLLSNTDSISVDGRTLITTESLRYAERRERVRVLI